MVVKGAFPQVLEICARTADGAALNAGARAALERQFEGWTRQGVRVLAVAARSLPEQSTCTRDDECDMTSMGFLTFLDRPKEGVAAAIADLAALGVSATAVVASSSRRPDRAPTHRPGHPAARIGCRLPVAESFSDCR
jgi:Mg2+-importing ATPase